MKNKRREEGMLARAYAELVTEFLEPIVGFWSLVAQLCQIFPNLVTAFTIKENVHTNCMQSSDLNFVSGSELLDRVL